MAIDAETWLMIGAISGNALAGAAQGPGYQERQSFEGGATDPRALLEQGVGTVQGTLDSLMADAAKPVQLQTRAQTPRGFTGGGLPFDIGLTGEDPGMAPLPGLDLTVPRRRLEGGTGRSAQPREGGDGGGINWGAIGKTAGQAAGLIPLLSKLFPFGGGPGEKPDAVEEAITRKLIEQEQAEAQAERAPRKAQPRPNVETSEEFRLPSGGGGSSSDIPESPGPGYFEELFGPNPPAAAVSTETTFTVPIEVLGGQVVDAFLLPREGPNGEDLAFDGETFYIQTEGGWMPVEL